MQPYDILMLLVLGGLTLFGFAKGMAWQVAYFSSFILSYFIALNFSSQLAPAFGQSEEFNRIAAMLAIYIASSFAIWMIFRVVAGAIDRVKLKEFDRQMGALVGFARGVLWCIAITFFAATLLESQRDAILNSRSGHYIAILLDKTHQIMPDEIHEVVHPYVEKIQEGIDPNHVPHPDEGSHAEPAVPQNGNPPSGWPVGGQASSTQPPATNPAPTSGWPTGQNTQPSAWPNQTATGNQQPSGWPGSGGVPARPASSNNF